MGSPWLGFRGFQLVMLTVLENIVLGVSSSSISSTESAIFSSSSRSPRLFTNPFGILGHQLCETNVRGRNLTGVCFNEVECFVRGGTFSGYCSPSSLSGVCCAFVNTICDRTLINKVSYFTNPAYPDFDGDPRVCIQTLNIRKDTCWVRLDYADFELKADLNGACFQDGFSVVNGADGRSGRFCGNKKYFSQIVRVDPNSSIKLAMIVQSQRYRWNIKITQVPCNLVRELKQVDNCGQTGADGVLKRKRTMKNLRANGAGSRPPKKRHPISRKQKNAKLNLLDVYHDVIRHNLGYSIPILSRQKETGQEQEEQSSKYSKRVGQVFDRKLQDEIYHPSFSARNVFCESKFRNEKLLGPSSKIIDGTEAAIHAFPWIVSLRFNGRHFCGGSLINEDTVITAAHCLNFGERKDLQSQLQVYLGEHDLSLTNETELTETRGVTRIIMHHRYSSGSIPIGDMALLKLERVVTFNQGIRPVCLPIDSNFSFAPSSGISAGWGVTEDGANSDVLRHVELNIIENSNCEAIFRDPALQIFPDMICAFKGPNGTESTCNGDSGGPLTVRQNNQHILVGLVSFGVIDCTAPFPAVFSRVTSFLDWIAVALST